MTNDQRDENNEDQNDDDKEGSLPSKEEIDKLRTQMEKFAKQLEPALYQIELAKKMGKHIDSQIAQTRKIVKIFAKEYERTQKIRKAFITQYSRAFRPISEFLQPVQDSFRRIRMKNPEIIADIPEFNIFVSREPAIYEAIIQNRELLLDILDSFSEMRQMIEKLLDSQLTEEEKQEIKKKYDEMREKDDKFYL